MYMRFKIDGVTSNVRVRIPSCMMINDGFENVFVVKEWKATAGMITMTDSWFLFVVSESCSKTFFHVKVV